MALDQIDIDKIDLEEYKKGNTVTEEKDMSFIEHLEDLRWTIIRSLLGTFVMTILVFLFKKFFIDYIIFGPTKGDFIGYQFLCKISALVKSDLLCFSNDLTIQNFRPSGQFMSHFHISVILGFVLAFPWVFWQIWLFIRPALHQKEQKAMRGVTFFAWLFFIVGLLFGYLLILPFSINFLTNYNLNSSIQNIYQLKEYTSFITMIVLSSGLMFELPMVIFLLSKIGIVTPELLRKQRKVAFVIILTLSAIITPPDVMSMILITIPIYFLYELSIFVSRYVIKRSKTNEEE